MSMERSREIALRLGVAARALPGVSVGPFVNGLVAQLGWPLTEEKLSLLTVTELRNALSQGGGINANVDPPSADVVERFGVERLKQVVEVLWGQRDDVEEEFLPPLDPYAEGDLPGSIRVAVATDGGEELNAHFGNCRRFLVYQLSVDECRLIDIRPADGADEAEDSSAFRAHLIDDCHVLFVQSIGGPAAAKVINAGIYPLKYVEGGPARGHLDELREKMACLPPPWLAKAMNIPVEDRIRFHVEEAQV